MNDRDKMEAIQFDPRPIKATVEEMKKARLRITCRDTCAHHLIALNKCRNESLYAPWKCGAEKHSYEICLYKEHLRRVKKKQLSKAEQLKNGFKKTT